MLRVLGRVLLGIEIAVLACLCAVLAPLALWGLLSITGGSVLMELALLVVLLGAVATIDVAVRWMRFGRMPDPPALLVRSAIALAAATLATVLSLYGQIFLRPEETWMNGYDFVSLGCLLWIPIAHLATVIRRGQLTNAWSGS